MQKTEHHNKRFAILIYQSFSIDVLALQRSLIILVGLTMACFSEKMMIFYNCIKNLEWHLTCSNDMQSKDLQLMQINFFLFFLFLVYQRSKRIFHQPQEFTMSVQFDFKKFQHRNNIVINVYKSFGEPGLSQAGWLGGFRLCPPQY